MKVKKVETIGVLTKHPSYKVEMWDGKGSFIRHKADCWVDLLYPEGPLIQDHVPLEKAFQLIREEA
tara:strand:+ start:2959 stop:3156 length:198 start_codon:yes stop_codon:yes gene_type:complete